MPETLAPDVLRFGMAPLRLANAYLLGDVLVDAGLPWSRRTIRPLVPAAFGSDHAVAHRSFARLIELEPHVVAFGHGAPLRGPAEVERALG